MIKIYNNLAYLCDVLSDLYYNRLDRIICEREPDTIWFIFIIVQTFSLAENRLFFKIWYLLLTVRVLVKTVLWETLTV